MERLARTRIAGVACALLALAGAGAAQRPEAPSAPYASSSPEGAPRIFGPGIISTGDFESHPAFTPDGKVLYYLKDAPDFSFWTIVLSRFENGAWAAPKVAPFSGLYSDADPFITADGSKFFFISTRPADGSATGDPKDLDIWMMERAGDGWGEPRNVGAPVNSAGNEWYPTIASNGTIYFGSDRPGGKGRTDLYRARLVDGRYAEPENLGDAVNTPAQEFEPFVAPDESFLIFMAGGRADGRGGFDLYVSYNRGGAWSKAVNLGEPINSPANEYSPKITPDGRYFFWTSTRGFGAEPNRTRLSVEQLEAKLRGPGNGLGDIYRIDVGALKLEK